MQSSEEEETEREVGAIERKYKILAIVFFIMGVIGFALMILGSSPAWIIPIGEAVGIVGFLGTIISVLNGGTLNNQRLMIDNQTRMIDNQKRMIDNQTRMIDNQKRMIDNQTRMIKLFEES